MSAPNEINEDNYVLDICDLFNVEQAFEVFLNHNAPAKEDMDALYKKIERLNELAKEKQK